MISSNVDLSRNVYLRHRVEKTSKKYKDKNYFDLLVENKIAERKIKKTSVYTKRIYIDG